MQAFYIYLTDWRAEMRPVRNRVSFLDSLWLINRCVAFCIFEYM